MTWQLLPTTATAARAWPCCATDGSLAAPTELKRWTTLMELLADWEQADGVLRGLDVADAPPVEHDALLAPLRWPRKVICAGVNYRRHMREMGGEIPAAGWRPFFFLKAPTTTIVGPSDPIIVRAPDEARYDWEAELAVVIGIGGRDIGAADALAHVAGYCVANDITARGRHKRDSGPGRGVRLRLVRRQVHGQLAAARAGHHPRLPGARSAGPAAAAVGERRAAAGRVHRRHGLPGRPS